MSHATFLPPDLGSFCRLDELGLQEAATRARLGDGFDGPGDAVAAERQACPCVQVPRLCLLATLRIFRADGPAWCPGNVVAGE
jgi:hypothetical protein